MTKYRYKKRKIKDDTITILGIGNTNTNQKDDKADQQRWGKDHKDKMDLRNMKAKQGGK